MIDTNNLILSKTRQTEFWSLIRTSPITLLGTLILINIMYPTIDNYLFTIFYIITFGSNIIFKAIFKGIYTFFGIDYIPFIGQGTRPFNAHSCSSFVSIPLIPATTFGMPSGHSQLAWFFAIYACLNIINCNFDYFQGIYVDWNKKLKCISCIILIIIAIIISYSRVAIEECHTTGQVIIGGLLGIICAIIAFKIKLSIIKRFIA